MKKINVNLYGGKGLFGGRETPLEAEEIYCDRYEQCSYYQAGKCLKCRAFLAPTCKFGRTNTIKGYTSRARKYYSFKSTYENDEVYSKLKYPSEPVAIMGDTLYIHYRYGTVRKRTEQDEKWVKDVDGYIIKTSNYKSSVFIPLNEVTNNLLFAIFSNKPRAIMGGIIEEYQNKVVPDIIQALKKVAPKIHKNFITEYPEFDVAPNYIGKYAFIKTMVNGSKLEDAHGNIFILENGKLICEKYKSSFVPFNGKIAKMEIDVRDDMEYKITSNNQCDENTRFA